MNCLTCGPTLSHGPMLTHWTVRKETRPFYHAIERLQGLSSLSGHANRFQTRRNRDILGRKSFNAASTSLNYGVHGDQWQNPFSVTHIRRVHLKSTTGERPSPGAASHESEGAE